MLYFEYSIIVILIQDKLIISIRGGNTDLDKRSEMPDISKLVLDFIPGDLKIKLPNKFNGNRSKLDPFLV